VARDGPGHRDPAPVAALLERDRIEPEKRTRCPRVTRVVLVWVVTRTATATPTIGLLTSGRLGTTIRYCVFSGTDSSGNANAPVAVVICGLPSGAKPWVYGNGLDCSTTARPALPVPVSAPPSTVGRPNRTGFGVAASVAPSGIVAVLNDRSLPSVVPLRLRATSR
jgi:hypothetical protein